MKKTMSILLASTIALTAITGCGKKEPAETTQSTGTKETASSVPSYMNEKGFPIVKQPITVKVMSSKGPTAGEYKDMELFKKMEQITGIKLEFDTPISTSYQEKKNLALASGDYPDVFLGGGITIKEEESYGPQGVFQQLDKYINQYAPHVKKAFEEYPDAKQASTATDGHIYSLPYIVKTKTTAAAIMYINLDWLNKVGMKKPTNVDEFYNVLKAFKEKDPNGNGQQDEIPLSYFKQATGTAGILNQIFITAFSGQTGGAGFDIKDGKVIYNPMQPYFKDFLTYMNKLYKEGLLDKEIFTQTLQQMAAKYKEGKMGISTASLSFTLNPGEKANYELISPLTSEKNSKKITPKLGFGSTGTFVITDKCKYPEAMMAWIDVLYRDVEGAVEGVAGLTNFLGVFGIDWKYGNAEKTTYTSVSRDPKITPVEYRTKYLAPQGFGKVVIDAVPDNDPLLLIKAVESGKEYHPYMGEGYPTVRYKAEDQEKLSLIETDLTTYVGQMIAKFIVGEEPLSNFDAYVENIKKMKIDEALKIRQAGLDAVKKAK